jgi:Flp pilus assembly protein TadG
VNNRGRRNQTGSTSLELVVLFPVLLAVIFGLVQGALWFHARNLASAAAQEGVRVVRVETGTVDAGRARAAGFLADAGGADVLTDPTIEIFADAQRVRVVVAGRSISVLPGVPGLAVEQSAAGPVERFTTRTGP